MNEFDLRTLQCTVCVFQPLILSTKLSKVRENSDKVAAAISASITHTVHNAPCVDIYLSPLVSAHRQKITVSCPVLLSQPALSINTDNATNQNARDRGRTDLFSNSLGERKITQQQLQTYNFTFRSSFLKISVFIFREANVSHPSQ